VARAELCQCAWESAARVLRVDEPLEVVGIVHKPGYGQLVLRMMAEVLRYRAIG
jgi:hypothetical protein